MSQKQAAIAKAAKTERNKSKKRNTKRRKAEEKQKEFEEAELLNAMSTVALEERTQQSLNRSHLEHWLAEATEEIDAMGAGAGSERIVGNGKSDGDCHDSESDASII